MTSDTAQTVVSQATSLFISVYLRSSAVPFFLGDRNSAVVLSDHATRRTDHRSIKMGTALKRHVGNLLHSPLSQGQHDFPSMMNLVRTQVEHAITTDEVFDRTVFGMRQSLGIKL